MAIDKSKKRQRPSRDEDEPEHSGSEDELEPGLLNGEISSDDEDEAEDELDGNESDSDESVDIFPDDDEDSLKVNEEDEEIDSDEIPSSDEEGDKSNDRHGDEEEEEDNVKVVTGADGNPRYIYPEIDPVYDSDDTDAEETNTIGNIPLEYYEAYPHIGYDINGKRIMRPAAGKALDALLDSIEIPKGWTGMIDKGTGRDLNLTQEELEMIKKIQMGEIPQDGYDPYPVRFLLARLADEELCTDSFSRIWWNTSHLRRKSCR